MFENNKLIIKISNGFGNQMFLYATSYAFSKKKKYKLLLDTKTGIDSLKKIDDKKKFKHYQPKFELDIFDLSANIADDRLCLYGLYGYIKKKIFIFLDKFLQKKRIIKEIKDSYKKTTFNNSFLKNQFNSNVYIDGYFESEKYFNEYRDDLLKEFTFKNKINCNLKFLDLINSSNAVSIAVRRDRYSEFESDNLNKVKIDKTLHFEKLQYNYINRSINYFKKEIKQPKFFLFSDNFDGLKDFFSETDDFVFVNSHLHNKTVEDFFLMYSCKHFIVAPTSFHWWSAWINNNHNKICVRPKDINPSNNSDFWPDSWISI